MSGVKYHLLHVRKGNKNKHHCPLVRCHFNSVGFVCHVTGVMGHMSGVRSNMVIGQIWSEKTKKVMLQRPKVFFEV